MHFLRGFHRTLVCMLCGFFLYGVCAASSSHALAPQVFFKSLYTLSPNIIKELAGIGLKEGSKRMGKELSRHINTIPSEPAHMRQNVIEDAYLRILVEQKRLSWAKAEALYRNLSGIEGFRHAMHAASSSSNIATHGHLYELFTASAMKDHGFEILAIGEKFQSAARGVMSDIDIVARKERQIYALQLKNYRPEKIRGNALMNFRAQMDDLAAYAKQNNAKAYFVCSHRPLDANIEKSLAAAAKSRGITLVYAALEEFQASPPIP